MLDHMCYWPVGQPHMVDSLLEAYRDPESQEAGVEHPVITVEWTVATTSEQMVLAVASVSLQVQIWEVLKRNGSAALLPAPSIDLLEVTSTPVLPFQLDIHNLISADNYSQLAIMLSLTENHLTYQQR